MRGLKEKILCYMQQGKNYTCKGLAKSFKADEVAIDRALSELVDAGRVSIQKREPGGGADRFRLLIKSSQNTIKREIEQFQPLVIDLLKNCPAGMYQRDMVDAIGFSKNQAQRVMTEMQKRGLAQKIHVKAQFYRWVLTAKAVAEKEWQPECEDADALRQLVSQQWRGSWLQGMEAVL